MADSTLTADYVVIGAGAMGMAFVDTMLTETDHSIIIVDAHDKPGGHWNDAYSFVTLHQPSAYYGVSSKELSRGQIDETGLNKGLEDLATGPEILAYFDDVMRRRFLPSGRVTYLPMHEYDWDTGTARSLLGNKTIKLDAQKKRVDGTWLKTSVPSTHTPPFEFYSSVTVEPINALPKVAKNFSNYMICGAGKTGMDAAIWLLENGCDPDQISWVMPRDSWVMDRGTTQTQLQFFEATMGNQANLMEAIAQSSSIDSLFERLEAAGCFMRIDPTVKPEMFHGATVSRGELEQLRRIKNIIRKGRIQRISDSEITLEKGSVPAEPDTLYVDCTACAVGNRETVPVFQGDTIRLQIIRTVQPVFSASMIAYIEATYEGDAKKNELSQIVPLPIRAIDWIPMQATAMMNQYIWSQDKPLRQWMQSNRLDGYSKMMKSVSEDDTEKLAILHRLREASVPAMGKLQEYIAEMEAS